MGRGPLNQIKHILPDYLLFLHVLHVLHEWPPIMNDKPICDNKWLLHCWGLPKLNPVITWSNPLTATLVLVKVLGDTCYCHPWHGSWFSIHYPRLFSQKFYYSLLIAVHTEYTALHCRTLSVVLQQSLRGSWSVSSVLYIVRRGAGNRTLATNQPEGNPTLSATAAARGSAS